MSTPAEPAQHFLTEVAITLPELRVIQTFKIALVKTSWNAALVNALTEFTKQALLKYGVPPGNIFEEVVPGAYELPFAAKVIGESKKAQAIICIGVLLKGETNHFEIISAACSQGLMDVQVQTGVPTIYGVLNCLNQSQAANRCSPQSQLPFSLASSAIQMAGLRAKYPKKRSDDDEDGDEE